MVSQNVVASKSLQIDTPAKIPTGSVSTPLSFQGLANFNIPKKVTPHTALLIERKCGPVMKLHSSEESPIGEAMLAEYGREIRNRGGIPRLASRATSLTSNERFRLYAFQQLGLAQRLRLYWYWFVTINLRPKEAHWDTINGLQDNLPEPSVWIGVHVPATAELQRHLHLVVATSELGASNLDNFTRRRNQRLGRSVCCELVYDLGGLVGYMTSDRNLQVKGASALACLLVKQSKIGVDSIFR